ncbi:MAG: T9SS type A sorting domain-containing protein [Bacteroidota bacterium]
MNKFSSPLRLIALFGFLALSGWLPAQVFGWAVPGTSTSDIGGMKVVTATNQDYVVAGIFTGSANFSGTTVTGSANESIFVCRYDSSGALQWATAFSNSEDLELGGIAAGSNNEVYLAGTFEENLSLGSTLLTNIDDENGFLARLDGSGNVVWALNIESSEEGSVSAVGVNGAGTVAIAGNFEDDLVLGSTTITSAAEEAIYVAAFDGSGNLQWTGQAESDDEATVFDLAPAGSSDWVMTGLFEDALTAGSTTLPNASGSDLFLIQFNNTGTVSWAEGIGGTSDVAGLGVTADGSGNVFVAGGFDGTADFSPVLTTGGGADAFLARYNNQGNVQWVSQFSSSADVNALGIHRAANNRILVTGSIGATATFDTVSVSNNSGQDLFIVAYNPSGSALFGKGAGGTSVTGFDVTSDAFDHPVVTGSFQTTAFFDNLTVNGVGGEDFVLAKLYNGNFTVGTGGNDLENTKVTLYPNPVAQKLYFELPEGSESGEWQLWDAQGRILRSVILDPARRWVDVSDLAAGLYLLTQPTTGSSLRFVKE